VRHKGREFVMADIPGLIEGAHGGAGIGDRFLGHVERCGALIHLVDAASDDAAEAYATVRRELEAYGHGLDEKAEIVALSRADVAVEKQLRAGKAALAETSGRTPLVVSAATGQGIEALLDAALLVLDRHEEDEPGSDARWRTT
jgi:GTP-binding protein